MDTSPKKITFFSSLGILSILLLCSPLIYFLWRRPTLNNTVSKFCCGLANPLLWWKTRAEHIKMHHRLEVIRNEQNIHLNQPETQDESNPNFESFSAHPTQKIHPEIVQMIVDLNQQLAKQSSTISQLEQKQLNSKLIIDSLTSSRTATTPRPSAPELDSVNSIMSHPVVTSTQAQQILANRTFPANTLSIGSVLKK